MTTVGIIGIPPRPGGTHAAHCKGVSRKSSGVRPRLLAAWLILGT